MGPRAGLTGGRGVTAGCIDRPGTGPGVVTYTPRPTCVHTAPAWIDGQGVRVERVGVRVGGESRGVRVGVEGRR